MGSLGPSSSGPTTPPRRGRLLGLPAEGKVVLVSGGGWGVGRSRGRRRDALELDSVSAVVCLCGRNDELAARLPRSSPADSAFARQKGFTEQIARLARRRRRARPLDRRADGARGAHARAARRSPSAGAAGTFAQTTPRSAASGSPRSRRRRRSCGRRSTDALVSRRRPGYLVRGVAVGGVGRARARREELTGRGPPRARAQACSGLLRGRSGSCARRAGLRARVQDPASALAHGRRRDHLRRRAHIRRARRPCSRRSPRPGATATFFLVGEQVERFPALAAEIAAAGHEIALHGYRHTLLLRRSPRALAADLDRAAAAIEDATGRAPAVYRPPYGVFSSHALRLVRLRGLGAAALVALGPRLGCERPADANRRARDERARRRETSCCCTTPTTTARRAPGVRRSRLCRRYSMRCAAIGAPCVAVTQST